MLRSNLCDYSKAYIVAERRISARDTNNPKTRNKKLAFKNNAPFRSCKSNQQHTYFQCQIS